MAHPLMSAHAFRHVPEIDEECPEPGAAGELRFGPFRLSRAERRLEREGIPVPLGGRALDILFALADRPGQVVSKAELARAVWPGMIVEEGSLRFHIVALRKALGESAQTGRYLTTVAGRGYCFTAAGTWAALAELPKPAPCLRRMIGMDLAAEQAGAELRACRFLTLVGPPGIGKTTLAVRLAHDLRRAYPDGIAFVDLGALDDPRLVSQAAVAAAGGMPIGNRRMLVVFDGCEHVIDAVAELAERLFRGFPDLGILATSREALRAEGEHVYRLSSLACPPPSMPACGEAALNYPAVELFVDRVQASQVGFQLSGEDALLAGEICRKLDGMPLALELAAGRVPAYGIKQTAMLLDGHFRLLWEGRRTAPPRLQTLNAAFDWSYDLLSPAEQAVLRRISVFAGSFTLEAAVAVAASDESDRAFVVRALAALVSKSLVELQEAPVGTHYRLLDTTRVYGLAKFLETEESRAILYRHATVCAAGTLPHIASHLLMTVS